MKTTAEYVPLIIFTITSFSENKAIARTVNAIPSKIFCFAKGIFKFFPN